MCYCLLFRSRIMSGKESKNLKGAHNQDAHLLHPQPVTAVTARTHNTERPIFGTFDAIRRLARAAMRRGGRRDIGQPELLAHQDVD